MAVKHMHERTHSNNTHTLTHKESKRLLGAPERCAVVLMVLRLSVLADGWPRCLRMPVVSRTWGLGLEVRKVKRVGGGGWAIALQRNSKATRLMYGNAIAGAGFDGQSRRMGGIFTGESGARVPWRNMVV